MKIEVECLLVSLLWIYEEYLYEDYFLFFLSIDIQCDEMLWIFNDQYIYKNAEERFLDASRDSLFFFFFFFKTRKKNFFFPFLLISIFFVFFFFFVKTRNTYYFLPFYIIAIFFVCYILFDLRYATLHDIL